MLKALITTLIISASIISHTFAAPSLQQTDSSSSAQISSQNSLFPTDITFLPVEQAFRVAPYIEGNELVFDWTIADNYYLYRDRFKIQTSAASVQLGPIVFESGKLKWDEFFEAELEVYYQQTRLRVLFDSGGQDFQLRLESQGCADAGLCYPPHSRWFKVNVATGAVASISAPPKQSAPDESRSASATPLWLVLLLALSGGLTLNLMPCVFPVLSIKVLSFTRSHQTTYEKQLHGLAYTAGVVVSFLAIAALMLFLRAAGEAIGWGFQLQSPGFVIFLIYLFTLMGLSLSGYLELGAGLMSLGQSASPNNNLSSSFMTGVLATTVASPCTAPFMGPALGFAIAQPTYLALLVFAVLGLGMALPFILLTWIPNLTNKLPKPGPWMEHLKQFLAFPLYITAIWLLWVAGRQTNIDVTITIIIGLLLISMAIWLWQLNRSTPTKIAAVSLLIGAIALPSISLKPVDQDQQWEPYSAQRLSSLRAQDKPVFINLTADWCITCLVNERVAFGKAFYQSLKDNGVVYLKGDWTNSDPEITKLLNRYNRNGVPLYLMYPKGQQAPEILPQILTETMLLDAIGRIK
jgi:thiol:disulfide interchange protein DsbD